MSGDVDLPPKATMERVRLDPSALIGSGGQSWVFALDASRVVRVLKRQPEPGALPRLQRFLDGIEGRLPVPTSVILEIAENESYTIERRLPGVSMLSLLPKLSAEERRLALANFAVAAALRLAKFRETAPALLFEGQTPKNLGEMATRYAKALGESNAGKARSVRSSGRDHF